MVQSLTKSLSPKNNKEEKDVLKQDKKVLKQKKEILEQGKDVLKQEKNSNCPVQRPWILTEK